MKRSHLFVAVSLLILAMISDSSNGQVGQRGWAPAFELPLVKKGGYVNSAELFENYRYTFLVFWQSGCPHCEEALMGCEEFYREYGGEDVTVAGINWGEEDIFHIRNVLEDSGISFLHMYDGEGTVARRYRVPLSMLTFYLVGSEGRIVSSVFDPQGEIPETMVEMLYGAESAGDSREEELKKQISAEGKMDSRREKQDRTDNGMASKVSEAAAQTEIVFGGLGRLRFISIEAEGDDAAGPYGEPVNTGNIFLHRFEMEAKRQICRYLTVGGFLRLSNEGIGVLRGGPDYFDSEWGSAFAQIERENFKLKLGYYTLHMTPLTMMRWDWDDNPKTGGDAGCGCGASAGVLMVESLEKLGPELRFEGARLEYTTRDHSLRVFYALPRRARPIKRTFSMYGGEEEACYSLETFGFDYRWRKGIARFGSHLEGGIHFAGSRENPNSIDPLELGYDYPFQWFHSDILSLTAEIPLFRYSGLVSLHGELIPYNRADIYNVGEGNNEIDRMRGNAAIAGVSFERENRIDILCDYIRLDKDFHSPFAAISYQPDREGIRASSAFRLLGERYLFSLFYKRLWETERPYPGIEKSRESLLGLTVDLDLDSGFGASLGYLDLGNWRNGKRSFNLTRIAKTASARYRFTKNSYIQASYQRVDVSDDTSGSELESQTDLLGVYIGSRF